MDEKAIYPYSLEYAKQSSPQDVEQYKLSHKQNIACKNALNKQYEKILTVCDLKKTVVNRLLQNLAMIE